MHDTEQMGDSGVPDRAATFAVDQMFLRRAHDALKAADSSAIRFLRENPGLPVTELAQRLNRGANAIGLVHAAYDDAAKTNSVRAIANDLLIRAILAEFPNGWVRDQNVHAIVKLGRWRSDLRDRFPGGPEAGYANAILREITIDLPPENGWKPEPERDSRIDSLFDRHWPTE